MAKKRAQKKVKTKGQANFESQVRELAAFYMAKHGRKSKESLIRLLALNTVGFTRLLDTYSSALGDLKGKIWERDVADGLYDYGREPC